MCFNQLCTMSYFFIHKNKMPGLRIAIFIALNICTLILVDQTIDICGIEDASWVLFDSCFAVAFIWFLFGLSFIIDEDDIALIVGIQIWLLSTVMTFVYGALYILSFANSWSIGEMTLYAWLTMNLFIIIPIVFHYKEGNLKY